VATLSEIARQHTSLQKPEIAHLQQLVREWGMLADFCFADLLLYVPARDGRFVVLGQVRPMTSQTLFQADWVGAFATDSERTLLAATAEEGRIEEGEVRVESLPERARMTTIPVRHDGKVIAVLTREWAPGIGRQAGELERTYLEIFSRLAKMIATGEFPFPDEKRKTELVPRVGDGVVVLDASARVEYASPNAVSALHRAGITTNAAGLRLSELGFHDAVVRTAFETRVPASEELEPTPDTALAARCIPLLHDGRVTGGVLLLRDVSELRRRDRMLLSKDATIREIHHRVKNNLQTISSLLRLQGRRLTSPEAKGAIEESVRRIRTIALVHETLSREAGDEVPFVDILRPLARMAEESLQSPDRPVRFRVLGDGGKLPAAIATPLAVVLTELLQNAVDHAFPEGTRRAPAGESQTVAVLLQNDGTTLSVTVCDNGVGLPEGFSIDSTRSLGLSIVRTLVTTELGGTIEMRASTVEDLRDAGLAASGSGTAVELRVPMEQEL
jgi:two-component system, sensor histidine kinase PdtaS